ncbi:hypothetical protein HNQ91_004118 [Filimonas zeae]|uniref:Uncharacterized protein n=1 Tax=Filimonas zeae TaxID=1737353 RepID=A0A917J3G7_9BACT|nr:hypothetical protein [Filimonas zeae]MDR6341045.1 hypothetical protein [Filimonas zeae]GGH77446.1 hypothetical protein GCM10011379_43810 [Filimonas zeae]
MTENSSDIWMEVPRSNVYTVPEWYFDTLPGHIMSHIRFSATLQTPQQTPYQVPTGYFDALSSRILSQVHLQAGASQQTVAGNKEVYQELQQLAPLLNTISKQPVFSIPENYFEVQLQMPVTVADTSTLRTLRVVRKVNSWLRYSAAAVVAGIMVTAAFVFTDNGGPAGNTSGNSTVKTGKSLDVKKEVSVLSEDEIVNYLSTHPSTADVSTSVTSVSPDIQHIVNDISEEEIRQYLKENSDPGEGLAKGI